MKYIIIIVSFFIISNPVLCQYHFEDIIKIPHTAVKNQQQTGTCWSFSTTSFLESELIRMGRGNMDLSEMFSVRKIYEDKAYNYVIRQGSANFSQGSLAHDVLRIVDKYGMVPQSEYSGLMGQDTAYNHGELVAVLKGMLDGVLSTKSPGPHWRKAYGSVLDQYMGVTPGTFINAGITFDPPLYGKNLGINPGDYISITSFNHHPYNESFILEIPDNYSNGSFLNVKLDQFETLIDNALSKGYSLVWDGDVGEKGFSQKKGIAIMPANVQGAIFEKPGTEIEVTQEIRQSAFESLSTTDDHLMHLVGRARDQNGTKYYIIKNSWGEQGPYRGLLYMSLSYFKLKTVSVTVHKNAIPEI